MRLNSTSSLVGCARKFIIGTLDPKLGVSFSSFPVVHDTAEQAREECLRLADQNPTSGKTFFFVQIMGGNRTEATIRRDSF